MWTIEVDGKDRWMMERVEPGVIWQYTVTMIEGHLRFYSHPMSDDNTHFDFEGTDLIEGANAAMVYESDKYRL